MYTADSGAPFNWFSSGLDGRASRIWRVESSSKLWKVQMWW